MSEQNIFVYHAHDREGRLLSALIRHFARNRSLTNERFRPQSGTDVSVPSRGDPAVVRTHAPLFDPERSASGRCDPPVCDQSYSSDGVGVAIDAVGERRWCDSQHHSRI
jgi:hypothetical protein